MFGRYCINIRVISPPVPPQQGGEVGGTDAKTNQPMLAIQVS